MARLAQSKEEKYQQLTLDLLEPLRIKGRLSPVYREMGNSEHALVAYLGLESAIKKCNLSGAEIEAIKLTISQINNCDFCLSVHSVKSTSVGLDLATQQLIRRGDATGNTRLDAIITLVRGFFNQRGPVSDEQLTLLRSEDLSDQDLMDIVLICGTMFLTNNFNHINDTELVFKPAPALANA